MQQIVSFPGLNLEFNVSQIALKIFGIDIYWYAIFIVIGILISLIICKIKNGKYGITFENIIELSIIMIPVGFICARLYYVLFNLDYYLSNPNQIFNIRNGRNGNIWRTSRRNNSSIHILQKKENKSIRPNRLYRSMCSNSPINRKMGEFCKYWSIWK